ncbi:hypothetical protein R6Q59_004325 [Mikania micrantha]
MLAIEALIILVNILPLNRGSKNEKSCHVSIVKSTFQLAANEHTMELADRAVGFILATISVTIFTYYTFWVIILPFIDKDHIVHKYFLPQEYTILLHVYVDVSLICFLLVFMGYVMLKSKKNA